MRHFEGFSLIEVLIALALISITSFTLIHQHHNLYQVLNQARQQALATTNATNKLEREQALGRKRAVLTLDSKKQYGI